MTCLDGMIGAGDHAFAGRRSVADPYAFVMARWTKMFPKTWEAYPHLARFMRAMEAEPAVAKALAASSAN